jgi:uncharacterized protein
MNRLLFILFFCFALIDTSYGQKQQATEKTKTVDTLQNPITDTVYLSKIAKGKKDSSFSTTDTSFFGYGEFSKSIYNIHFSAKPLGWISDFDTIFTSAQIIELDSTISNFEKLTTNEIAIVTIDSLWTNKEKFDDLILTIANKWGVGKKGLNNGIVIGISTKLRKIRICNGYGIAEKLSDAETKNIIDEIIIPEYKKGNYFEGTKNGLLALMRKLF